MIAGLVLALLASAAAMTTELGLRNASEFSSRPLTTERIWELAPNELNPHRARWILEKDVRLEGLRTRPLPGKKVGVEGGEIQSAARVHVRPQGPWYSELKKFTCEQQPNSWFATYEGASEAGREAARIWSEVLEQSRERLSLKLERIRGDSAQEVIKRAQEDLKSWLLQAELEWQARSRSGARAAEWRYYLSEGAKLRMCKADRPPVVAEEPPHWRDLVEQPAAQPNRQLMARAPARRWGGMYSVRVSVTFGDKNLNGQFLVDSGAAMSVISPDWLVAQGVNPALIRRTDLQPQRVSWSGGTGIAYRAFGLGTHLGGVALPLREFLLMKTELFQPPESVASCCDGILGADFLRYFAVEFTATRPYELKLWNRKGFSQGASQTWVEVATSAKGEPISSACFLAPEKAPPGKNPPELVGVRWDTGSQVPIEAHLPWRESVARVPSGTGWQLQCGRDGLGRGLPIAVPPAPRADGLGFLRERLPALNVGIPVLARGGFTLDLANGRLWFEPAGLRAELGRNRSGLELEFLNNEEGDRELRVERIAPGSPAAELAGLARGQRVTEIDRKPVEDLDLWEIEQILGGPSQTVTLNWNARSGPKSGVLRVR